ncbi:DUF4878 domain-containing protein [Tumebacillus permanentifrigoris]|uniref:Uncharacterized protein DUF4878 n=1 Tax=Tumebacillus permanentifrigoris TaxID=378543 RepID=A0A316DA04_9BACL|nr:DUF4878 domain-containing protein [Tumebacillus permanentifrigoris]PWK14311.1 uncharacterized protein DUF4878 [Tumebacillus permanentifrigoris]
MNKKTTLLATLIAVGVAGGLYFGVSKSQASATPEQEAKQAVKQYVDGLKTGNVDKIMQYSKDVRFKNDAERKQLYSNLTNEQDVLKAEVVSVKLVDDSHATFELHAKLKSAGIQDVTLPVVKEDGTWKVVIEDIDLKKNAE